MTPNITALRRNVETLFNDSSAAGDGDPILAVAPLVTWSLRDEQRWSVTTAHLAAATWQVSRALARDTAFWTDLEQATAGCVSAELALTALHDGIDDPDAGSFAAALWCSFGPGAEPELLAGLAALALLVRWSAGGWPRLPDPA